MTKAKPLEDLNLKPGDKVRFQDRDDIMTFDRIGSLTGNKNHGFFIFSNDPRVGFAGDKLATLISGKGKEKEKFSKLCELELRCGDEVHFKTEDEIRIFQRVSNTGSYIFKDNPFLGYHKNKLARKFS